MVAGRRATRICQRWYPLSGVRCSWPTCGTNVGRVFPGRVNEALAFLRDACAQVVAIGSNARRLGLRSDVANRCWRHRVMSVDKPVRRIAIVGTGVIGGSWAAQYLARGFDVVATDPAPNAEAELRKYVDTAWAALSVIGLSPKASPRRLEFTSDMRQAVSTADVVQENAPERTEFKIKLFADLDDATPVDSIIASSSSGITMSVIQSACKHPERTVIGHPFNPPHLIPLVEVVGGAKTSPETIQRAMAFYASIGKKPIRLFKALPGHVSNRLQAALYK